MPINLPSSALVGTIATMVVLATGTALAVTSPEVRQGLRLAQAAMPGQGQTTQQGQPGMMGPGMMGPGMGQGMMGRGMMGADTAGDMRPRKTRKREHMMKIGFAIADRDGDGTLSFEEVVDIHRRIFNAVDADKDGRVTPDELRNFLQN